MTIDDNGTEPVEDNPYATPSKSQDVTVAHWTFRIVPVLIGVVITSFIFLLFFLPAIRRFPEVSWRTQCKNNLKQIGLALRSYVHAYGDLPPSYTVDSTGKPLHSWRTLLLPFMDGEELYEKLDLKKPWDDPVNQEVFNHVHTSYSCLSSKQEPRLTHYLAICGDESCFPRGRSIAFKDIKDELDSTILIVEAPAELSVPWMSPQDLSVDRFLSIGSKTKFNHVGGFHALMGDGTARFINANTSNETLRALITRDANDVPGVF